MDIIVPKQNGLGTASFVLGIVGFVLALIPVVGWFLSPVAFTGLGVGLGNIPRLKDGRSDAHSFTWIGVGLSSGAILVGILYVIAAIIGAHTHTNS